MHINSLNHHQTRAPHPNGPNPLDFVGVFKSPTGAYWLAEKIWVATDPFARGGTWQWRPYADYAVAVSLPRYLREPLAANVVVPLSVDTPTYDFVTDRGHLNLGAWIDHAANAAGR